MKYVILTLMLAFTNIGITHASCEFTGSELSDVDKQELKILCETKILDGKKIPSSIIEGLDAANPEQLSQWGVVAQEWAKALGLAASEMGIAADKFLDTGAGKLTAGLIIWQVMGDALMGFFVGIPMLFVTIIVGLQVARRVKIESITYHEARTIFGRPKVNEVVYKNMSEAETAFYWLTHVAIIILCMLNLGFIFP